jgi:hypothetical protein
MRQKPEMGGYNDPDMMKALARRRETHGKEDDLIASLQEENTAMKTELELLRAVAHGAMPWFKMEMGGLRHLSDPMKAWVQFQGWQHWVCGVVTGQHRNILGDYRDSICAARNYWDPQKNEEPPTTCHRCRQPRKDYIPEERP